MVSIGGFSIGGFSIGGFDRWFRSTGEPGERRFAPTGGDGRTGRTAVRPYGMGILKLSISQLNFAMKYDRDRHHRQSIRLRGHNYASAGIYFITTCTHNRECLFGTVDEGSMKLTDFGKIISEEWQKSWKIRPEFQFHEWIVMPNHFHAIIQIKIENSTESLATSIVQDDRGILPIEKRMRPKSISSLMAGFKSSTTKRINQVRDTPQHPVWQRCFYDYIIRNEIAFQRVENYIRNNPIAWHQDQLHPQNPSKW